MHPASRESMSPATSSSPRSVSPDVPVVPEPWPRSRQRLALWIGPTRLHSWMICLLPDGDVFKSHFPYNGCIFLSDGFGSGQSKETPKPWCERRRLGPRDPGKTPPLHFLCHLNCRIVAENRRVLLSLLLGVWSRLSRQSLLSWNASGWSGLVCTRAEALLEAPRVSC